MDELKTVTEQSLPKQQSYKFNFTGNISEFFGIWIVNNILTLFTLGIYSPWAKVRTLQYFYGNTELAGSYFNFTASPLVMLRSRLIAMGLLFAFFISDYSDSSIAWWVYIGFIVAYFLFVPALLVFVLSFRLRYSQWRGINFGFKKNFKEAYRIYLLPLLALALALGSFWVPFNSEKVELFLGMESPAFQWEEVVDEYFEDNIDADRVLYLEQEMEEEYPQDDLLSDDYYVDEEYDDSEDWGDMDDENSYVNPYFFALPILLLMLFFAALPYFDFISQRFVVSNANFGKAKAQFVASLTDYYYVYGYWFLAVLALSLLILGLYFAVDEFPMVVFVVLFFMLGIPSSRAYFKAKRYNLLLNGTVIDKQHFLKANIPFLGLLGLMITNSLMVAITFGMMTPWAKVRTASFMFSFTSLESLSSFEDFVADLQNEDSYLGEEIADAFDLDIGI